MMQKREHVLRYMLQGYVHLSKKDYGFFHNIQRLTSEKHTITTNQNNLFEKLIAKYSRQLLKQGHNPTDLLNLSWESLLVETTKEYTSAFVTSDNETILLRCPFNNKFINQFRKVTNNTFIWNKEKKQYESPFTTHALKTIHTLLPQNFDDVVYSQEILNLLYEVNQYNDCVFEPTLMEINGNLIVVACNDVLGERLKDVKLEKTAACFHKLSRLGIKVDESLLTSSLLKFAASYQYTVDFYDIDKLISWIKDIGETHVLMGNREMVKTSINNKLMKDLFTQNNIVYMGVSNKYFALEEEVQEFIDDNKPVLVSWHSNSVTRFLKSKFCKQVTLKNSYPILIK